MVRKTNRVGVWIKKEDYEYEGKRYEADVKSGDRVKILDGGEVVAGDKGDPTVFTIETRNGERNAPFNQSSINILIEAYGDDSENWIGKEVRVLTKKGVFGGQKGIACYFVTDGWTLDDYGDLVKGTASVPAEPENIKPEDIPF